MTPVTLAVVLGVLVLTAFWVGVAVGELVGLRKARELFDKHFPGGR
jgi:hypothetical protein